MKKVKMHLPEYQPDKINQEQLLKEPAIFNCFFFTHGFIMIHTAEDLSDGYIPMLKRFASVFEQTYTRFLDLQKAEAQAREAKIEASLERVRSKAMSMHSSEDLALTIDHFFHELKSLNIKPIRCGVGIKEGDSRTVDVIVTSATKSGGDIKLTGKLTLGGHPILDKVYEALQLQAEYFPVLRGEEISEYYKAMNPEIEFPNFTEDDVQYGYYFHYEEGGVFAWTEKELLEEEINIFRKFKSVLSLTYRRYIDLKEAESRAIESVRQASLDRVRAEIASMRTSEDLNHITPIIWSELKNLEVPFFRCGVYIVDEKTQTVQVYLTTPDGKSLGVLNLAFDSNEITSNTVDHWRKKIVYKTHWDKEEFISWTESMMKLGQIKSAETYQGSTTPPESLYLHFVPFAQGMLYVGDVQPLTGEKLELVKTLAEAFSIAYARYEDFKNLEEAKNKIELTLNELKAAQAQLVHSEKMASLGELTAGIAHEIKNPLNFVNNFSEVSRELLDEMKIEIENKNIDEVIDLIEDLKQNLEKINQHGKRADSIVKGMLLHSRGTSGEKTPTDINDLLDQYVNLAYHGMRAQNKEFNISIEKNYDETLEKINVVPQDISRVFLNIINNACYAAFDKKKKSGNDFSPTLRVSTKKLNDKVEIKIGDNGNGITADHLDKIFQPFFTTKPSGEGTGLGLSLSYDIVTKVHSGVMKVETKVGEGTEFLILLPSH
jgi:signal transduction histidine kinase